MYSFKLLHDNPIVTSSTAPSDQTVILTVSQNCFYLWLGVPRQGGVQGLLLEDSMVLEIKSKLASCKAKAQQTEILPSLRIVFKEL